MDLEAQGVQVDQEVLVGLEDHNQERQQNLQKPPGCLVVREDPEVLEVLVAPGALGDQGALVDQQLSHQVMIYL